MTQIQNLFESLGFRIWILPFDWAQGGEPVEPFVICKWVLGILLICDARVVIKYLNVHWIRSHELAPVWGVIKQEMTGFEDTGVVSAISPAQTGQRQGL